MKELSRKTFLTIFCILTLFNLISVILVNVQSYKRERESVERNLSFFDNRGGWFDPGSMAGNEPPAFDGEMPENIPDIPNNDPNNQNNNLDNMGFNPELENALIMDYEVYTIELTNHTISKVINHGNDNADFDVESITNNIINKYTPGTKKIGNLFIADYTFDYKFENIIVVMNNSEIKAKLLKFLIEMLLVFAVLEGVIFFLSKLITKWITKPAHDAFDKQKEFIADASHELKTPLAVIMASSDELSGEENKKYIENIKYESDRMSRLISGMLDLSKLEQSASDDSYSESFKEEKLSKLVEKNCLVFEGVAFENGVEIDTDIEKGITINCIKDEIEKLVSTLLDNAVKHSYKDSTVNVKLYKEKSSIILKVINTGDPINPGDEEKIFERFYRSDKSRNRNENRYGLGLAIAKRIALNHGGEIKAYSKDGKTTLKVTFHVKGN